MRYSVILSVVANCHVSSVGKDLHYRQFWNKKIKMHDDIMGSGDSLWGENATYKLSFQLALGAMASLALDPSPAAVVRAHIQVIISGDALAQVRCSRPEVGKGRLGAWTGFGTPAALKVVFALHVILQTPQLSYMGVELGRNDARQPNSPVKVQQRLRVKYL